MKPNTTMKCDICLEEKPVTGSISDGLGYVHCKDCLAVGRRRSAHIEKLPEPEPEPKDE